MYINIVKTDDERWHIIKHKTSCKLFDRKKAIEKDQIFFNKGETNPAKCFLTKNKKRSYSHKYICTHCLGNLMAWGVVEKANSHF